jgi:hypothetical protein
VEAVVERALESLSLVVGSQAHEAAGSGLDRALASYYLELLRSSGQRVDPEEVTAWAASNGWAAAQASELGAIAAAVLDRAPAADQRRPRRLRGLDPVLAQWRDHRRIY